MPPISRPASLAPSPSPYSQTDSSRLRRRNAAAMAIPDSLDPKIPLILPELPLLNDELRCQVFTHASAAIVTNQSYDRLCILGNTVLINAVTRILFECCNGELSKYQITEWRNKFVSAACVGAWARAYGFQRLVKTNFPAPLDGKSQIPGDAFQAYLGAVSLVGTQELVVEFLKDLLEPALAEVGVEDQVDVTIVAKFHERLIKLGVSLPNYNTTVDEEADPNARFTVRCVLGGRMLGKGVGRSIQQAKWKAAGAAMNCRDRQFTMLKGKEDDGS